MDILAFLKYRTKFIINYYETAVAPFQEIMRKIDTGEFPFEPPYSENGEPPFLSEWIDAETAIILLGGQCISMLSDSLKLYIETHDREHRLGCLDQFKDVRKKRGFLHAFCECLSFHFNPDWGTNLADMDIVEGVVLARRTAQHPDDIASILVYHRIADIQRHGTPFSSATMRKGYLRTKTLGRLLGCRLRLST